MSIRKYHERSPRNTTEQYLDDLSQAADQQIKVACVNGSVRTDVITVSDTPVLAAVDVDPLDNRHSLEIINDSSFLVYFGFTENVAVGVDAILINSGSAVTINLNPNQTTNVWVVSPDLPVEIKIAEVS